MVRIPRAFFFDSLPKMSIQGLEQRQFDLLKWQYPYEIEQILPLGFLP